MQCHQVKKNWSLQDVTDQFNTDKDHHTVVCPPIASVRWGDSDWSGTRMDVALACLQQVCGIFDLLQAEQRSKQTNKQTNKQTHVWLPSPLQSNLLRKSIKSSVCSLNAKKPLGGGCRICEIIGTLIPGSICLIEHELLLPWSLQPCKRWLFKIECGCVCVCVCVQAHVCLFKRMCVVPGDISWNKDFQIVYCSGPMYLDVGKSS